MGETNSCIFCSNRIRTVVAMATYTFLWLIMGKVESGNFCCLTAEIKIFFLQKCFLNSPLGFIWILSKSLNVIGCHGNIKGKFSKKYSKIFSSEAIRGMKLKVSIRVDGISLNINCVFLLSLPMWFRCYGNLKFPQTYNGKSGNWHLFLCYCRYFDKSFTAMFLE